jgi:hypothetical protein
MNVSNNGEAPDAPHLKFESLVSLRRWVAWQLERSGERVTKVPYDPNRDRKAKADDPGTWDSAEKAFARYENLPKPYDDGGIGFELGPLDEVTAVGGIDLDTCCTRDTPIAPWAQQVIDRIASYTEWSPSGTGAKILFRYNSADLPELRDSMGGNAWGKSFKWPGKEHPPGIEIYFGRRFFATTAQGLGGAPDYLRAVSLGDLLWLIEEAGPAFEQSKPVERQADCAAIGATSAPAEFTSERIAQLCDQHPMLARRWRGDFSGLNDNSRSGMAMALGGALRRAGCDFAEMCEALRSHPATKEWAKEKGDADDGRQLRRIWDSAETKSEVTSDPKHKEPSLAVFRRTLLPTPVLPIGAFGPFWGNWITCAAEGANAPADYPALALLSASSALIGNARWVTPWPGWSEPPSLWTAGVGDPSTGKTPGAATVTRDVLPMVEAYMARHFPALHDEWLASNVAATARRKDWEKAVANAVALGEQPPAMPADLYSGDEPHPLRVRVGNITIEKFVQILSRLPKGALCSHDELASLLGNFQRYSSGTDRPFWLEAYSGTPYPYDRVKNDKPIMIPRLTVSVFGTIQPDKLAPVLSGDDDGLVGRFLWGWPDPIPFRRPAAGANVRAATDALSRLADLDMVDDDNGSLKPVLIPLRDDAADVFESFVRRLCQQEAQAHGLLKSALGKARGQALRLALVLEFLWWCGGSHAEPTTIQRRVVEAAIDMMERYFLPMAAKVFGDAAVPTEERHARVLAGWIVKTKPEVVNVTAVRDNARLPGLRETKHVKAACHFLVEANVLEDVSQTSQRGRPRGDYRVNPRLWELLSEYPD